MEPEELLLHGSLRVARTLNRDLACILWVIFERMGVGPNSYRRVQILKGIAQNVPAGRGALRGAIGEVLQQCKDLKPDRGLIDSARTQGIDAALHYTQILVRVNMIKVDGLARLLMLPEWAQLGFPTVQLGHRLAASLGVTRISADVMDAMELPWPVFEVELPDGMFTTSVNDNTMPQLFELGFMLCGRIRAPFANNTEGYTSIRDFMDAEDMPTSYALIATSVPCSLWSIRASIAQLGTKLDQRANGDYGLLKGDKDPILDRVSLPINLIDSDSRTVAILTRVFVNAALMLTAGHFRTVGKAHGVPLHSATGNQRSCPVPVHRLFSLTTPIRHDFRGAIQDYIRGGGAQPTVQGIVTGHWKMQPHGAGRAQRRLQFIEPYWRGPEDAPIAVRPTRLG